MVFFRIAIVFFFLVFASFILAVSIFRTVSPQHVFSQIKRETPQKAEVVKKPIDYYLVYPGILPDHFLWPLKALRDQAWVFFTTDPMRKAELYLLFADKRIGAAKVLLEGGKSGLAFSTASKAEKYLEQAVAQEKFAREKGLDTGALLDKLALASLKHREVLEEMYVKAGEDARPKIVEVLNYPKRLFDEVKMRLLDLNRPIPESPFE